MAADCSFRSAYTRPEGEMEVAGRLSPTSGGRRTDRLAANPTNRAIYAYRPSGKPAIVVEIVNPREV